MNWLASPRYGSWPVSRYSSASAVSTIGWPSMPSSVPRNVIHQVVREPPGHREQRRIPGSALAGDPGLDQVARAVQLVAGGQEAVPGTAGDLDVGVQVAVGLLRLLQQRGRLGQEAGQVLVRGPAQFPADRLQDLVDVGVHEHRAPVPLPGARDGQPHVGQVPGRLELAQRQRQAGPGVALLPRVQQPGGQPGTGARTGQGTVRDRGGRGGNGRPPGRPGLSSGHHAPRPGRRQPAVRRGNPSASRTTADTSGHMPFLGIRFPS